MEHHKEKNDPLSMVANLSGIASFILAVAGNNVEKLSLLQKYGLAITSAVMLWTFMGGALLRHAKAHDDRHDRPRVMATLLFGGWIGAGLLLAALPLFSFGLGPDQRDTISLVAAGTFGAIFTIMSIASIWVC